MVETEAPIMRNLLARRVLAAWGISKLGTRINAQFEQFLGDVYLKKTVTEKVDTAEHSSGEDSLCLGSDKESGNKKSCAEIGKNDENIKRKFSENEGEVFGTDVNNDSDDDDSLFFG